MTISQQTRRGCVAHRWRLLMATFLVVGLAAGSTASQAAERLIVALDPPTVETNRFWGTDGATGVLPSHEMLVGNDPLTGAYDNSALAESWEANADFTEWTFRLHPDAAFHGDWGPVTTQDVAHSYDLHAQDISTLTGVAQLRGANLEIVDDHTIKFIFEDPRQAFLFTVASRGSMVVYSKAQFDAEGLEGYDRNPAGTGHYQFVERTPGVGILYQRVEDHWSGQDALFEELEFRWASEPSTKLAMLLAGEAHITDLPRELMGDALADGKEIIASQGPAIQVAVMLHGLYQTSDDPAHRPDLPWADIRIREAMNRAVNRDEMLDVLYDGRAEPMVRYGMHEPHEGFNAALVERFDGMYGYDPERAKALLDEAGYPDAFEEPVIPLISTVLSGNPEFGTMIELVQVYFEAIGLQTEIREMDWASLGALGRGRQAYVVSPIRNAPIRPTEVHLINAYTQGGSPYHGYEDDAVVGLIDELQVTFVAEERGRIAGEAFAQLFEQYSDVPVASIRVEVAVDPAMVAGWPFPGVTSAGISHWNLIKPAN